MKNMTPTISVADLKDILAQNDPRVACIDVRTPEEYVHSHIPGVPNIPLNDLARHSEKLKNYDTVYVHCRSGGRSAKACAILSSSGIPRAFNVAGGILAWQKLSYPLVTENGK